MYWIIIPFDIVYVQCAICLIKMSSSLFFWSVCWLLVVNQVSSLFENFHSSHKYPELKFYWERKIMWLPLGIIFVLFPLSHIQAFLWFEIKWKGNHIPEFCIYKVLGWDKNNLVSHITLKCSEHLAFCGPGKK